MLKRRLAQPGTEAIDLVDAVISAVHEVRPGGEKAATPAGDQETPMFGPAAPPALGPEPPTKQRSVAPKAKEAAKRREPRIEAEVSARSPIVNPVPTFIRLLQVSANGRATLPSVVEFEGIKVRIDSVKSRLLLTVEDDTPDVVVTFTVVEAWQGAKLADGTVLKDGAGGSVSFPKPQSPERNR